VCCFSFNRPTISIPLDIAASLEGLACEAPGGLYYAEDGQHKDAIIVSSVPISHGFEELAVRPILHDLQPKFFESVRAFSLLALWSEARFAGPLADMRRKSVISSIQRQVHARLYGPRWVDAETAYHASSSDFALRRLTESIGGAPGFSSTLRMDCEKMAAGSVQEAQWFSEVAARYQVCSDPSLCNFALSFAIQPQRLHLIYGKELYGWLLRIRDKGILLRGARLLTVLGSMESTPAGGDPLRGTW
jgi:hypothetical protein